MAACAARLRVGHRIIPRHFRATLPHPYEAGDQIRHRAVAVVAAGRGVAGMLCVLAVKRPARLRRGNGV